MYFICVKNRIMIFYNFRQRIHLFYQFLLHFVHFSLQYFFLHMIWFIILIHCFLFHFRIHPLFSFTFPANTCILLARTVPAGFRGTGAAFRSVLSYINRKICIEKISPFSVKRHIEGDTMYEVDFSKPIHIHFIGIGGISMSGLARFF